MGETSSGREVDEVELARVRARQGGVVSARQLRQAGLRPHEVKRRLRRHELVVVHRGVYAAHTGPLTRHEQAWAAVLALWPAALTRVSALPSSSDDGPLHVAIGDRRTVDAPPGVVVHRTAGLQHRVRWNDNPPAVAVEHAALDVASAALAAGDVTRAFAVLADACQSRRTTPGRIRDALSNRGRVVGRRLLAGLLDDLDQGACSVLEREWLLVERAHGLPVPERQVQHQVSGRRTYRDAEHGDLGVVVELDGRAFHDDATARDRDAERDLLAAVDDEALTVRLTWGQVFRDGCRTAGQVGLLLRARGWPGSTTACGPGCSAGAAGLARDAGPPGGPR